MIIASSDKAPPSVRPYIHHLASAVAFAVVGWDAVQPYLFLAFNQAVWAYNQLPDDILNALFGLLLCFFGGTFAVLIAAVEAFRMTGWSQTRDNVLALYDEYLVVKAKYEEDEKHDKNNDGVPDVQQKTPSELLLHKTHLFVTSVKNPDKISSAITGIFSSCLSVAAVLRIQFAKTVTLGVSIGNAMRNAAESFLMPTLNQLTPVEYRHWLPTVVNYVCKSIAISIAWYIQKVVSAIHSSIRGGLMFTRHMFEFCNKRGYFHLKHEDTNIDEISGWALAAIGVYFQITSGFTLPFPLNLLLLPFTFAEWVIIWLVSDTDVVLA